MESRWKVLGGVFAILLALAAGAAAQQHIAETSGAVSLPLGDSQGAPKFIVLPDSPEEIDSPEDFLDDDEDGDETIEFIPFAPIVSPGFNGGFNEFKGGISVADLPDDDDNDVHDDDDDDDDDFPFGIDSPEVFVNPFSQPEPFIPVNNGFSGASNNGFRPIGEPIGIPLPATRPQSGQGSISSPSATGISFENTRPQVSQNENGIAENIGIPLPTTNIQNVNGIAENTGIPLPTTNIQNVNGITENTGIPLPTTNIQNVNGIAENTGVPLPTTNIQNVNGIAENIGIPLPTTNIQNVNGIGENTGIPLPATNVLSQGNTIESEIIGIPLIPAGPQVNQNRFAQIVEAGIPLSETDSQLPSSGQPENVIIVTDNSGSSGNPLNATGPPNPDILIQVDETLTPVKGYSAPEQIGTTENESSVPEVVVEDTEEKTIDEPNVSEVAPGITDEITTDPPEILEDNTDDLNVDIRIGDDAGEEELNQVSPTSPAEEVQQVMAELAAAAPENEQSEQETGEIPENEVEEQLEEEVVVISDQETADDAKQEAGEARDMDALIPDNSLVFEEEMVSFTDLPKVANMTIEDMGKLPSVIADDAFTGEVYSDSDLVTEPNISMSDLDMFFVADDPQAMAAEEELGKGVTQILQQLPEDQVDIAGLPDIVPYSPDEEVPIVEEASATQAPVYDHSIDDTIINDFDDNLPVQNAPDQETPIVMAEETIPIIIDGVPPLEEVSAVIPDEAAPVEELPKLEDAPVDDIPIMKIPVAMPDEAKYVDEVSAVDEMVIEDIPVQDISEMIPAEFLPVDDILVIEEDLIEDVQPGLILEEDMPVQSEVQPPVTDISMVDLMEDELPEIEISEEDIAAIMGDFGEKLPETNLTENIDVRFPVLDNAPAPAPEIDSMFMMFEPAPIDESGPVAEVQPALIPDYDDISVTEPMPIISIEYEDVLTEDLGPVIFSDSDETTVDDFMPAVFPDEVNPIKVEESVLDDASSIVDSSPISDSSSFSEEDIIMMMSFDAAPLDSTSPENESPSPVVPDMIPSEEFSPPPPPIETPTSGVSDTISTDGIPSADSVASGVPLIPIPVSIDDFSTGDLPVEDEAPVVALSPASEMSPEPAYAPTTTTTLAPVEASTLAEAPAAILTAAPAPVTDPAPSPPKVSPPVITDDKFGPPKPSSVHSFYNPTSKVPATYRPTSPYRPYRPATSHFHYKEPKPEHHKPNYAPSPQYAAPTQSYKPYKLQSYSRPTYKPQSYDYPPAKPFSYGTTTTKKPLIKSYAPPTSPPMTYKPRPTYNMYRPSPSNYKAPSPTYQPHISYKAPSPSYRPYKASAPTYKPSQMTYKPASSYKPLPTSQKPYKPSSTKAEKPKPPSKPILAPLLIPGEPSGLVLPEKTRNSPYRLWNIPSPSERRQRLQVPDSIVHLLNAPQPEWVSSFEPQR